MLTESDCGVPKSERILEEVVQAMADMVDVRDPYTARHQYSVAQLSVEIGRQLGISDWQIKGVQQAATIHDIGKLYVPSEILCKPGKLNVSEFDLIKLHPQIGHRILKGIEFLWPVAQIVLQHHERVNGSGYPDGLSSDNILIESKILSVADVIEAMSSDRPYRPALGINAALEEIVKNKSILYDDQVVEACLSVFAKKPIKISENIQDSFMYPAALAF